MKINFPDFENKNHVLGCMAFFGALLLALILRVYYQQQDCRGRAGDSLRVYERCMNEHRI